MKNPTRLLAMLYAMGLVFLFLAETCFLSSCNQKNYQVNRMKFYAVKYPTDFSILANQLNPCFNGILKSDTIINQRKPDTVFKTGDSIIVRRHDTTFITRNDTIKIKMVVYKTVHDSVSDKRAIDALQAKYNSKTDSLIKLKAQFSDTQSTSTHRLLWIIGLVVLIVILVYFFAK